MKVPGLDESASCRRPGATSTSDSCKPL